MASLVYLDASAIVKLVAEEGESPTLGGALRDRPHRVPARSPSSRSTSPPLTLRIPLMTCNRRHFDRVEELRVVALA